MNTFKKLGSVMALGILAITPLSLSGCSQKEQILDVETPGGEVEVEKDKATGDVEVEVNEK